MTESFLMFLTFKKRTFTQKQQRSFSGIFTNPSSAFFIIPELDNGWREALLIPRYFAQNGYSVTLLCNESLAGQLQSEGFQQLITYTKKEINLYGIPKHSLSKIIAAGNYGLVIDLTRNGGRFGMYAARMANADFYAGIAKKYAERFFQFVFSSNNSNLSEFYNNFLDCIKMF